MFRYIVYHNGDCLAGFNHRPDAEAFQRNRCDGLAVAPSCYPIVDSWATGPEEHIPVAEVEVMPYLTCSGWDAMAWVPELDEVIAAGPYTRWEFENKPRRM